MTSPLPLGLISFHGEVEAVEVEESRYLVELREYEGHDELNHPDDAQY